MDFTALLASPWYNWLILPLLIFFARILDVSIGTIRVIFISRGLKFLAPMLGFFEVLIWLLAIRQVMANLSSPLYFIAYAAGFATGTFVGIVLEDKISIGKVIIRIIARDHAKDLIKELQKRNYHITTSNAKGSYGKVKIVFTITQRHNIPRVAEIINQFQPHAFYSIEDIRYSSDVEASLPWYKKIYLNRFGFFRKGK
ncbi:MAG: DUF2179 domain-containing protein [Candidatus Nanoarchaeia archaeon]|nr:DUF2179 domain-containing protein [Candidatus Nanoarchaeia archaeon]